MCLQSFLIVNDVTAYKKVNPPDVEEGDEENINYIGQNNITHRVTPFIFYNSRVCEDVDHQLDRSSVVAV